MGPRAASSRAVFASRLGLSVAGGRPQAREGQGHGAVGSHGVTDPLGLRVALQQHHHRVGVARAPAEGSPRAAARCTLDRSWPGDGSAERWGHGQLPSGSTSPGLRRMVPSMCQFLPPHTLKLASLIELQRRPASPSATSATAPLACEVLNCNGGVVVISFSLT